MIGVRIDDNDQTRQVEFLAQNLIDASELSSFLLIGLDWINYCFLYVCLMEIDMFELGHQLEVI